MFGDHEVDPWDLKRNNFRNEIRQKQIQKIKKQKREVVHQTFAFNKSMETYGNILNHPQFIYQNGEKYIQVLYQSLSWEGIHLFKQQFSQVIIKMIDYYQGINTIQQGFNHLLFWECIGSLYYEGSFSMNINAKIIQLCLDNFDFNNPYLFSRCLIVIQNMTCTQDQHILKTVADSECLIKIQQYLQTYPCETHMKEEIMNLMGNLLETILQHSYNGYYFPTIIFSCLQETTSDSLIEKGVQVCIILLSHARVQVQTLLAQIQNFLFVLIKAQQYIPQIQLFTLKLLSKLFMLNQKSKVQIETFYFRIEDILSKLSSFQLTQKGIKQYINSCSLMIELGFKSIGVNNSSDTLVTLINQIFNYWIENENFEIFAAESELINFVFLVVQQDQLFHQVIKSRQNIMRTSTWEVIIEFLKQVNLQTLNNISSFIKIMSLRQIPSLIPISYRNDFFYKIQGCFNSLNDKDPNQRPILYLTQAALNNFEKMI